MTNPDWDLPSLSQLSRREDRSNKEPDKRALGILLWLICGPIFTFGALVALVMPDVAIVLIVGLLVLGMVVSAVRMTAFLES